MMKIFGVACRGHTPQHVCEVSKEYSKQNSQNWADCFIFVYACCMFNETIPEQCTTVLHRDMHYSWVFPLLIEDNIACTLSTLEYLIPLCSQLTFYKFLLQF